MMKIGSAFVCVAFLFGCGGDDGLDTSLELADLDAGEITELCASTETRTIQCDGFSLKTSPAICEDNITDTPDTCTATVGDSLACSAALADLTDAEICDPDAVLPAACDDALDDSCFPPE
jgi:hypothetical protein